MRNELITYTHTELVQRARRWLEGSHKYGNYTCGFVLTEYHSYAPEQPDAIGFRSDKSILIECKVSRADFKADGHKSHRQGRRRLGNERFYMVPAGMVAREETPDGWGLLFVHDKRVTIEVEPPYHSDLEIQAAEHSLFYSLLRRAELRGLIPRLLEPLAGTN
jgi:hypothetical protein